MKTGGRLSDRDRYLVAELGNLDALPDQARLTESALDFALLWPRDVPAEQIGTPQWTRDNGAYTFEFKRACFDPASGRLELTALRANCWTFEITHTGSGVDRRRDIPPLPIKCPQCNADWELFTSGQRRTGRSGTRAAPVRRSATWVRGYEKIVQVLVDALGRELLDDGDLARRLVLFSDSRQDAAKLSAGLEKRHYQDLVRQLIVEQLASSSLPMTSRRCAPSCWVIARRMLLRPTNGSEQRSQISTTRSATYTTRLPAAEGRHWIVGLRRRPQVERSQRSRST